MKQTQNIAPAAVSTGLHSTGPTRSAAMLQLKGRGRKQRIRQGSVRRCHMRPGCCVNVCVGGARGGGGAGGRGGSRSWHRIAFLRRWVFLYRGFQFGASR